jgi:hypothetical protein
MVNCGREHYQENLEDFGNLSATSFMLIIIRKYNSRRVDLSDLSIAPNCISNPFASYLF